MTTGPRPSWWIMRLIWTAVLAGALAAQAPATAWACHDTPCSAETPTPIAVNIGIDAALLFADLRWAGQGTRPGRAWGALEVGVAGLQGLVAFGYGFSEDHDYQGAAQLGMASAAVVAAHGLYVLIRGADPGPQKSIGIAPLIRDDSAALVLTGRF
jgi:hypothetical protein